MSDGPPEKDTDRSTGTDTRPLTDELPARQEVIRDISLNRRQSRTIQSPRKWKIHGLGQRICPECRVIVPGIPDGFWHLQTAHNQGKGLDLEAWGTELRDELDEFIAASRGRRGYVDGIPERHISPMGWFVLATVVVLLVLGFAYAAFHG